MGVNSTDSHSKFSKATSKKSNSDSAIFLYKGLQYIRLITWLTDCNTYDWLIVRYVKLG